MRLAVVAVLGVTACGDDPSLRVDVEHPIAVSRTVISVYESEGFRCEQVEFGDRSEAELLAARVAELTIEDGGATSGSLDGLSRTETKLVVARGFDADGTLATGGCVEQGLIAGHARVKVTTERAALASIGPLALSGPDPFSLTVVLTDTRGLALKGNELSWRVWGPSGSTAAPSPNDLIDEASGVWRLDQPTCVSGEGLRTIHPVPPSTVGGFAVQVRPSWAIEPPPMVTGFTRIDPGVYPLVSAGLRHPCALRATATTTSLVCVEERASGDPTLVGREYGVTVAAGSVTIAKLGIDFDVEDETIALYSVPRAGNVRDVYAVTRAGRVFGVRSPSIAPPLRLGLRAGFATDALLLPRCGAGVDPRVLMRIETLSERKIVVMDELGGPDVDFHDIKVDLAQVINMRTTGCVTELDPVRIIGARQSVVVELPARGTAPAGTRISSAYFDCGFSRADQCYVDLPVTRAGVGYFPGETPLLAGANLDASGVVVSRWAVLLDNAGYRRVELDRVAAAAAPLHIVYGQFDDDGEHDAFWDVVNVDQSESAFQITYAQLAAGQPLSALSAGQPLLVSEILVGDVTADGKDDLVVLGISNPATTPVFGVAVVPSQVPTTLPPLLRKDTCP